VTLRRTDLTEPLDSADADGFDLVFSHLVLGHVEAWTPVLEEFARVLAPGGRLQFTTVHPQYLARHDEVRNYYDRRRIVVEWPGRAEIPVYYRSTADALNPVADAGFRIERVREPEPCEAYAEHAPERHEAARRRPEVLCVRAELVG
jgi:SAM-dependent methyltransferase